jgi:hypothetical protein
MGIALLLVHAAPVFAQAPRPERPYRGLFGSGTADAGQVLTASGSLSTGWDSNIIADATGSSGLGPTQAPAQSGSLGGATGSLSYSLQTGGFTLGASAATNARYYPSLENNFMRGTQGRINLSTSLWSSTSLTFSASAMYQPYVMGLFPAPIEVAPGEGVVPDLDPASTLENYFAITGDAAVSHRLTRNTSLSVGYSQRVAERPGEDGEMTQQRANGRLTHQIGRGLSLHGGYGFGEARYPDGHRQDLQQIDAGVDFNRALSLTRRTTVSFSTGSTATNSNDKLRFHLTGGAQLTHELGRTWSTWITYGRQVQFHEALSEPTMGDSMLVGIGGLISRRVQVTAALRGAIGSVGVENDAPGFDSYYATATASYALTRFMNVGVSYAYYSHRFDDAVQLSGGIPNSLDRQSVRASVSLWAPIFQRTRRANASR